VALPFTAEDFFAVFARYNAAVWPAQLALAAAAVWVCAAVARGRAWRGVLGVLAALWLWMGLAYHLAFFRAINPAAGPFAALFVAQAALLTGAALRRCAPARPPRGPRRVVGWTLVAYALAGYPLLGLAAGQRWPAFPTFGLPCPTTIFTLGALLLLAPRAPRWLFAVPLLWALVGTVAAFELGVPEDLGLAVAASATLPLLFRGHGSTGRLSEVSAKTGA
jgi:hypothetical protein